MYLVMTSLLALNVSKDVINAFVVVNENIVTTNKNFSNKLDDVYTDFEKNYQFNKLKVAPFWEKAQQARLLSEEMEEYVRNVRYELISMTEGVSLDSAKLLSVVDLKKKDNNTIPTNYFIGNGDDGSGGKAMELKERLVAYRNQMLELIPSEYKDHFEMGLSTDGPYYNADGQKQSWEIHYFYNTILAADIPLLNKIISDIYNAEYDVVNLLYKSIAVHLK